MAAVADAPERRAISGVMMGWMLFFFLVLILGFPLMMMVAALSLGLWLVWAILGLVWAIFTFLLHDAALALLLVAVLWLGYRMGRNRQAQDSAAPPAPRLPH